MSEQKISRRRALTIIAAAAASFATGPGRAARSRPFEWRGTALGASARLILWHTDQDEARKTVEECLLEIERLEDIFSLYRPDSEISRLNRQGSLEEASLDMRRLIHMSRLIFEETEGAFDPTVQTLWRVYANQFFEQAGKFSLGDRIEVRRANIGMHRVHIDGGKILMSPDTAVTFNGIAQGYITDRVADLLRSRGWSNVLLDLGEVRALDNRRDGSPWRILVREGNQQLALSNAALATSSGTSLTFSEDGKMTHILDPRTGMSPHHWLSLTVRHPYAAMADALSTGLYVTPPEHFARILKRFPGTVAWATNTSGKMDIFDT